MNKLNLSSTHTRSLSTLITISLLVWLTYPQLVMNNNQAQSMDFMGTNNPSCQMMHTTEEAANACDFDYDS